MKETLLKSILMGLGLVFVQGCYTQMVVERKVVVVPEVKSADTVVVITEEHSLVHEYRYWFDDYSYYSPPYYSYPYTSGYYIDISWYDPFYSPWYGYATPICDPWWGYGPYCYCHGGWNHHGYYGHHNGGWFTWDNHHSHGEPDPPRKKREWTKRDDADFTGIFDRNPQPGTTVYTGSSSGITKSSDRPTLTRNGSDKGVTKIERKNDDITTFIKRITRAASQSSEIKNNKKSRAGTSSKAVKKSRKTENKTVRSRPKSSRDKESPSRIRTTTPRISKKSKRN